MAERDPRGLDLNTPGAKADADKHRPHLVFAGFARALEAVSEVGTEGAKKYSDFGHYKVPNGVERYTNAMQRHYLAECKGEEIDPKSGFLHAAHTAWNALARLELMLVQAERSEIIASPTWEFLKGYSRMKQPGLRLDDTPKAPLAASQVIYAHCGVPPQEKL